MKKTIIASVIGAAVLTSGCKANPPEETADINETSQANVSSTVSSETQITFEVLTLYDEFVPLPLDFAPYGAKYGNLPEGSAELFEKAIEIWSLYHINSMICDEKDAETITMPIDNSSYVYYRTGVSYNDFINYLKTVFTSEWVDDTQENNATFINNLDELLCLNTSGVINTDFSSITFEITEQTDDFISVTGLAKYEADDGYTYEKELPQRMKKVNGEWRLSEFNCWF